MRRSEIEQPIWLSGAVALLFAAVHIAGRSMRFLQSTPRSIWLSTAGGVSTAYVFVHLIPELADWQERLVEASGDEGGFAEHHVYVLALAGLALFYGVNRLIRQSALRQANAGGEKRASEEVFWVHLGSYALYSVLIGYLLVHREDDGLAGLAIYALALALHFVVNDQGLRQDHGARYDARGRWILAAAPLVGWLLGIATELSASFVASLFALLAGGIVLNVMKEELPEERESRFLAFAAGAAGFTALLLAAA